MNRLPDFFIIGAPKCGTTALYHYLAQHPRIFMPDFKEPHYFARDFTSPYYIRSEESYRELFATSAMSQRIGEASVWYLFSEVATRHIRDAIPEAKLLVMLRRPVDLFVSLHNQLIVSLYENENDPEKAWFLQEKRLSGMAIPELCEEPRFLQYDAACRLGCQLQRLFRVFPRSSIQVILFDDFAASPQRIYEQALQFLDLPSDGRHEFPRVNEAHQSRSVALETLRRKVDRVLVSTPSLAGLLRLFAPVRPLSRAIRRLNERKVIKAELSESFRRQLTEHFKDDVELLEELLERDLTPWKEISTAETS